MFYFEQFPKIAYDVLGTDDFKLTPDIFRRVKTRSKILNNVVLLDDYDIQEGDSPETVAFKAYGDAKYFFVVCLVNNIVNRYYDWPLDEFNFQQYVKDKYDNAESIHHYEKIQSSGKLKGDGPSDYSHMVEVNSTELGAGAVSNIEYERRLQDKKRTIKMLEPQYLNAFVTEFKKMINR
tara:strand:+ start:7719 stop:8255 length:537 start_codon:yes stop_codon:yes gene_type:complete